MSQLEKLETMFAREIALSGMDLGEYIADRVAYWAEVYRETRNELDYEMVRKFRLVARQLAQRNAA